MPLRDDIETVLIIGSGPIVIGQACEFDYSGTQACKVLRAAGYRVALVNSNPATIMTDPDLADATYVEPLTPEVVERVIALERARTTRGGLAVLPTLGGQTGLNIAMTLAERGVLERHGVELIGARPGTIRVAEDRRAFTEAMGDIGLEVALSGRARDLEEARGLAARFGYPLLVRASFTLGGGGSGVAYDDDSFARLAAEGLAASPIGEIQVDESLLGWKEFELEVMRDRADNCVIVCSIENVDPMGVHTGDSITVAPALTLTDREYQEMRDAAFAILRRVGVETGGSNVQFAVDPATGRQIVVEMNPRVSRSSALASKATGFPIAKIAALLAVGMTLDEIPNDITGETLAAFEPSIDYTVVKIPRFAFEKFPAVDPVLTTRMQSVGEVMAIGRTFKEALGKALRGLEDGGAGLDGSFRPGAAGPGDAGADRGRLGAALPTDGDWDRALAVGTPWRLAAVDGALTAGWSVEEVADRSRIDPWFVDQIAEVGEVRAAVADVGSLPALGADLLRHAKRVGLSDAVLAGLLGADELAVRAARGRLGVLPVFKTVDTCAAEFAARTPYHYSTYEQQSEVASSDRPRVLILGSGPNRIGQGIEFDYCCVHAVQALHEAGYETVMVNCNPETVSTDYDTADRLYFEPLTLEDVLAVHDAEVAASADADHPGGRVGVLVQLGGQTPLGLARGLQEQGVRILGTQPDAIDLAEDRGHFNALLDSLGIAQPPGGVARTPADAPAITERVGYPVLVRPSYVLGGRSMAIIDSPAQLDAWLQANAGEGDVLIDRFLESATEVDVDAVYDGTELYLGGILEHIEEAGVHSGDSACVLPPYTLGRAQVDALRDATEAIAGALRTRGLINVQYALRDGAPFVLEANPRASRTVPFTSKATGVALAKVAARVMAGERLADLRDAGLLPVGDAATGPEPGHLAVKEAVLPFNRFPGVDTHLGPEMRSTGEVMGLDVSFGAAFAKSQMGTGAMVLPVKGRVFCSIADRDKRAVVLGVKRLADLGFELFATEGTARMLARAGVRAQVLAKVSDVGADAPGGIVDRLRTGGIDLVLNTPRGRGPRVDGAEIRRAAVAAGVPCATTVPGILAAVQGIEALQADTLSVRCLQDWQRESDRARREAT